MSPSISRRELIRAAALAGGTIAFGVPEALLSAPAEAYTAPSKMAWWSQARFGMFIHFGSYSYLGHGEWAFSFENWTKAAYQTQVSAPFDPTAFNAATIVGLAKAAGMKYLVITSKHHEGFAMWHSNVAGFTDTTGTKLYNLYDYTADKSDLLGALKAECDAQGIKFGLYYSILDWNHPSQTIRHSEGTTYSTMASLTARTAYIADLKSHLQELLTRYDPAILWFDGDWCANPATVTLADWWLESDGLDLYNWLIAQKPSLIVNERVKRGFGLGDFDCPEQTVPASPGPRPWETNATMNGAWGYNVASENSYRSSTAIIQEFVTVASRDGNYLLNIGPKGDGTPTPGSVAILNDLAAWMGTYSDSIYGTNGSPFAADPSWGRYTKKPGKLFAHVFSWPTTGVLQVPLISNTISRVYPMSDPAESLGYTVSGGTIDITIPTNAPDTHDSVIAIEVTGPPAVVAGGTYKLVCAYSGKALDNGSSTAQGAPVMQWTDNGGPQQHWTITNVETGYYRLVCAYSGMALDNDSSTTQGAAVVQWPEDAGTPQHWAIVPLGGGYFQLVNRYSGMALDNASKTGNGSTVVQWGTDNGTPQKWQLVRVG